MWIYLSPHLDDAVYSCGGLISAQVAAGEEVAVWTFLAGQPPVGPLSKAAKLVHQNTAGPAEMLAQRRAEDRLVCEQLGVAFRHFDFCDAVYRQVPTGDGGAGPPLYADPRLIFHCPAPWDRLLVERIVETLLDALPAGATLVCPLGFGNHVDHLLIRTAAEMAAVAALASGHRPAALWYYADLPYVLREKVRQDKLLEDGWTPLTQELGAKDIEAWKNAIQAYESQLVQLWETREAMHAAIDEYVAQQAGAQLWAKDGKSMLHAPGLRNKPRVLLIPHQRGPISPRRPMGGGPTSFFELAASLAKAGAEVTLLAQLDEEKSYRHDGAAYVCIKGGELLEQHLSLLSDRAFDIVIAQRADLLDRALRHFPFAVSILRVIDTFIKAQGRTAAFINQRFDFVIAVSQFVRSLLIDWGVRERMTMAAHDGLNTDVFGRRDDIRREENLVLFVGAVVNAKGLPILAAAMRLLVAEGVDAKLEIHGASSIWSGLEDKMDWEATAANLPFLVYRGVSDKQALVEAYNRAAVCVVPTDPELISEGFGRVSLEAQACGCPVLVSHSGGLVETLIDGETGRIVDPLTVQNLAAAIREILADAPARERMSKAAPAHATSLTVDRVAEGILQLAEQRRERRTAREKSLKEAGHVV